MIINVKCDIIFDMSVESQKLISRLSSNKIVESLLVQMDDSKGDCYSEDCDSFNFVSTSAHCIETASFLAGATNLLGLDYETAEALALGSLLHDAGKCSIPPEILHSSCRLSDEEMKIVFDHPIIGAIRIRDEAEKDLAQSRPSFLKWQWDVAVSLAAIHHRYKTNKSKRYPNAGSISDLKKENIIDKNAMEFVKTKGLGEALAICDVYSAISLNRPYMSDRLASEKLVNPIFETNIYDRVTTIENAVKYELNISKFGACVLANISEQYLLQF